LQGACEGWGREGGRERGREGGAIGTYVNIYLDLTHVLAPPFFCLAQYFNGYMRGPFASFCARREWEHERGSEGATGGGVEGILPPLFAHGHRRLPLPMSGGSRQHHLQQVQMLTVGGKGRAGGREGGRERGSVRC